jgi:hypothetical protein
MTDGEPGACAHNDPARGTQSPPRRGIRWDRVIELFFAFAIMIATVFNVWVARWQWQSMNESNQISTRPYFKITLKPEAFDLVVPNGGFSGITFNVQNTGRLPGLAYIQTAADWRDHGQTHQPSWPSFTHVADAFIFPGDDPVDFNSSTITITQGQLLDLVNSGTGSPSLKFYVMVDVLYGEKRQYETRVCKSFEMIGNLTKEIRLGGPVELCPERNSNYAK